MIPPYVNCDHKYRRVKPLEIGRGVRILCATIFFSIVSSLVSPVFPFLVFALGALMALHHFALAEAATGGDLECVRCGSKT